MVRPSAADAAAVQGHSGSGERAFGYSRRAHASQAGMLSPLVQVVQLVLVSGAEEAQSQLAVQRRCGAALASAARAQLSGAAAALLVTVAADPMGVLLVVLLPARRLRSCQLELALACGCAVAELRRSSARGGDGGGDGDGGSAALRDGRAAGPAPGGAADTTASALTRLSPSPNRATRAPTQP